MLNPWYYSPVLGSAELCQKEVCGVLSAGDNTDPTLKTYGWWVGRTFQPMYYWGGAAPGSGKCACGLDEKGCRGGKPTCNCDADLPTQTSDMGE